MLFMCKDVSRSMPTMASAQCDSDALALFAVPVNLPRRGVSVEWFHGRAMSISAGRKGGGL